MSVSEYPSPFFRLQVSFWTFYLTLIIRQIDSFIVRAMFKKLTDDDD